MTPGRFIKKALAHGWRPPGITCAVKFDRLHRVRCGVHFVSFYSLDDSDYFEVRLGKILNDPAAWEAVGLEKPASPIAV